MKRVLIVIMLITLTLCLTACGTGDNYFEDNDVCMPNGVRVAEWVSPDGVHYWILHDQGIAPRYNRLGCIVTD